MKRIFVLILPLLLTACASGAKVEGMVSQASMGNYPSEIQKNIDVSDISGGKETNPMWTSEIDSESFKKALEMSLDAQSLYSSDGEYTLRAVLLEVDQPMFGVNFEVTTQVRYTLTRNSNNQIVWDKVLKAPYTATIGDAFAGVKRLRLANEGSARENIDMLLKELEKLNLSGKSISLK